MQTASLAVDYVQKLLDHNILGSRLVLLSPYKTQSELHRTLLSAAAKSNVRAASEIAEVRCSTVQSYTGEEAYYIIHDTCSRTGQAYVEVACSAVIFSRAQVGFAYIGSTKALLNHNDTFKESHPCKVVLRNMIRTGRYESLRVNSRMMPRLESTLKTRKFAMLHFDVFSRQFTRASAGTGGSNAFSNLPSDLFECHHSDADTTGNAMPLLWIEYEFGQRGIVRRIVVGVYHPEIYRNSGAREPLATASRERPLTIKRLSGAIREQLVGFITVALNRSPIWPAYLCSRQYFNYRPADRR
ncbi:hypothetical protein OPT61_g4776 [Boeremia exigua]|uniref:Uncharacterized protein n=1 Tax=Boeremia exigua TaxID=749465 RepID=A0ACC2ICT7_9PLEO|nr:hypothetical protein OPT61_g4776 [Boeremia exigua]